NCLAGFENHASCVWIRISVSSSKQAHRLFGERPLTSTTRTINHRRRIPMYRLRLLMSVVATFFFSLALCSLAQAAPRTFVSGLGSDANPCTREAPCRTFQVAHNAVDANGEVLALDSAGYGTLTINKNVTISGEGVEATANATTPIDAITINTAGLKVVLRSITVEGFGTGNNGINVTAGNLTIQHCVIHGFRFNGLDFVSQGTGKLSVSDSR